MQIKTICLDQSLPISNRGYAILAICHFTTHFDLKDKMKEDAEFIVGGV